LAYEFTINGFKLSTINLIQIPVCISILLINKSGLWMNGPGEEEERDKGYGGKRKI
jgi:hypothetical protein